MDEKQGINTADPTHALDSPTVDAVLALAEATEATPDVTAGDGLRFEIGAAALGALLRPRTIKGPFSGEQAEEIADAVLALPALRDLLAAAARNAEKVPQTDVYRVGYRDGYIDADNGHVPRVALAGEQ